MSFVPATSNRDALAIVVIAVVAVLAVFLRRASKDESDGAPGDIAPVESTPGSGADPPLDSSLDDDDDPEDTVMAITSDGWAFMPDEDEVQLVPVTTAEGGEEDPMAQPGLRRLSMAKPGEHLDAGDFIGARVVRGSPGADPWRLEAIGHDGEYRSWAFENEEAARTALDLIVTRIVRTPVDEYRNPTPPGDAEYAAAAALTEAGVADLAMDTGDDDDLPETFTR